MRIGASLAGAQQRILHSLAAANAASALSALRLATGKQFTRPSDGPAAFLQIQSIERDQSAAHVATDVGSQSAEQGCSS